MRLGSLRSSLLWAAVGGVPLAAGAVEPATPESRIQELEAKVTALEAKQAANSKDLADTVDSVLRDAERRSQLLANSGDASAGYDNGFFIRAGDAWVLRPGAQFQFRNITNFREEAKADGDSDIENGFEIRRMRFELAGTALSKDLAYLFMWETARDSGQVSLLDAWARYSFADDWGVRVGQFKDLVTHEFLMSSKRQLAVDTSLVDSLIGGGVTGYTQGATLIYGGYNKNNPLNIEAAITDGANQANTDFTGRTDFASAVPKPHTFDFGIAGRAEYKLFGDWKSYGDFTAKGNKEDLLVLGTGGDWSQGGDGNQIIGTADIQYENASGFGAYGALLARNTNADLTGSSGDATDWGGLVQASYLLSSQWEVFGRYDVTFYDNGASLKRAGVSTGDVQDAFSEITVGVNYYLGADGSAGHRAKFTVDLSYLPDGAPKAVTGLGILDNNNGEAEWVLRAQFQLLI
ncbi:MAG: porin [Bacillota bacterium]